MNFNINDFFVLFRKSVCSHTFIQKLLQKEVNDYVTSYVGSSDSTFSFDDIMSSTELL